MEDVLLGWIWNGVYAVLTFMAGYLWNKLRAMNAKQTNMEAGIRVLLRCRLRDIHAEAVKRGFITYEELQDAEDVYSKYHKMGGNGRGTALIEDINGLPVREMIVVHDGGDKQ